MYKMVEGLMPAETFLIPQKQGHQIKSSTATFCVRKPRGKLHPKQSQTLHSVMVNNTNSKTLSPQELP